MTAKLPKLPTLGTQLTRLPLRLEPVRHLEVFEGPLLSERKDENGQVYLEKLCTCDDTTQRTLVVRSDQRSITEYLHGRLSMRQLFLQRSGGIGFLFDYARDGFQRASMVELSILPAKYLPTEKAFHDLALRPHWPRVPQEFLVNQQWNAHVLSEIEKLYLDVHAFTFAAKHRPRLIQNALLANHNSGYVYYNTFKTLRASVPWEDRADTEGVHAASPGVLSMSAPRHVAVEITRALIRVQDESAKKAHRAVHKWSKLKKDAAKDVPASAVGDIKALCNALGVDSTALLPQSAFLNTTLDKGDDAEQQKIEILQAGKLIVGYSKRLRDLLEPADGVEFLVDWTLADDDDVEDVEDDDEDDVEDEDEDVEDDYDDEDYDDEDDDDA